jgi:hypothetical protein
MVSRPQVAGLREECETPLVGSVPEGAGGPVCRVKAE